MGNPKVLKVYQSFCSSGIMMVCRDQNTLPHKDSWRLGVPTHRLSAVVEYSFFLLPFQPLDAWQSMFANNAPADSLLNNV
jgi:hypothetical protein